MVTAQDYAGGIFDGNGYTQEVMEIHKKYPGSGTGQPGKKFLYWTGFGFYWPKSVPLSPRGNPGINGIVSGQLFDSVTPYVWTQQMKQAFPSTNLLTSQSYEHGMGHSVSFRTDPSCQTFIQEYFQTGVVPFEDGMVCGAPFADRCEVVSIFGVNCLQ